MQPNELKFIFFGSSEFSVIVLKHLIDNSYLPLAVVTAPDMPVGRKQILTPTPIKILAQEKNIPVLQPENFVVNKNFCSLLQNFGSKQTDIFIVASYGKIIPKNILDLPKFGALNVHPSLLPKYRGASPIQAAILNGETKTGVTIILMDEKMDHGPILSQVDCAISENEIFFELHNRLAEIGAELLIKNIPEFLSGKIKPKDQNHDTATFCKIIKKENGEIDWQKSAKEIYNQWRAYSLWPGIFCQLAINNQQTTIKFIKINIADKNVTPTFRSDKSNNDFFVQNKKLYIAAGDGQMLEIIKLQPEGKKIMTASDFINGYLKNSADEKSVV